MFGFHIVGSFLPGLFEALFSLFDPEKRPIITISHPIETHIHTCEIHYFTLSKNKNSSLDFPDDGYVVFGHNDLSLSKRQSSSFEMTHSGLLLHGENQQCHYTWALKRQLISMLELTIYSFI